MRFEKLMDSLAMILTEDDIRRIECRWEEDDIAYVVMDLHGLTGKQAERLIKNVICLGNGEFVINAIHGFNHGTVIKRMLMKTQLSSRVVTLYSPDWNPGQTYITVAA